MTIYKGNFMTTATPSTVTPSKPTTSPVINAAVSAPAATTITVTKPNEPIKRIRYNKDSVITIVATSNPKRKGTLTYTRFALYKNGMTIADYVKAGGRTGDINYDIIAGYITVA
jgi:hypothetical protein